jgi:hypothetical protein
MGVAGCDGIVALARVVGTVCGDAADVLIWRYLAEQVWQHRCVANAAGDLDGPYLLRFLINANMELTP